MHSVANAPLPAHDEKTDAVLLYSETDVTVVATDKVRTTVREAYKILRPNGRERGSVYVYFNPERKIKSLHGWCIPAQGKDYEIKDKDAFDRALSDGGELVNDVKYRVLMIPAPDPGNIVGYEYEVEERPFFLQDIWGFQEHDPVRESHYSLQLPPGWEFKSTWLNHPEVKATDGGNNLWKWTVSDVKEIRAEPAMPPCKESRDIWLSRFSRLAVKRRMDLLSGTIWAGGTTSCWLGGLTLLQQSNRKSQL